jgi:hypothetical protein
MARKGPSVFYKKMKQIIPLHLVELEAGNYHLTAKSSFSDGSEGLWVIDSGASKTVFDQALQHLYEQVATDEGTQLQSAGIGAGRLETSLGKLLPFTLGSLKVPELQVALIDLSHINKLYFHATEKEICGLIGSDFLLDKKAVIDYGRLELLLNDQ